MGDRTKIQWSEATWNPTVGCDKVSAGCKNCYAETFTERFRGVEGSHFETGFDLTLWPDRLDIPRKWTKPRRVFVNSLSDLFHKDIPLEFVKQIFQVMNETPRHTYQILTKRHERLAELADQFTWTDNIWMGVSIEDRHNLNRMDYLRRVPAKVRFVSAEPLLGPLTGADFHDISWIICGGESGPGARLMEPGWAEYIMWRANTLNIPVFMKQTGSVLAKHWGLKDRKGGDIEESRNGCGSENGREVIRHEETAQNAIPQRR